MYIHKYTCIYTLKVHSSFDMNYMVDENVTKDETAILQAAVSNDDIAEMLLALENPER
jgi:hypothetical protein